jgi:hypothetical protein
MTTRALSALNYVNQIGCPSGYHRYTNPYAREVNGVNVGSPAGAQARLKFVVLSTTLADFDGKQISLINIGSASAPVTTTFDDDAAPPSVINTIRISGLTTVAQIAEQCKITFALQGFVIEDADPADGEFWIIQPIGGDAGNATVAFPSGDLSGEIEINGIDDFVGFDVKFYGGNSIDVPVQYGPRFGLAPGPIDLVQFVEQPV